MRALFAAAALVFVLSATPAFCDTDRIDIKDPARAAKALALLYVDIGKGTVSFFKDIFLALDDVPKAILMDIFRTGRKKG